MIDIKSVLTKILRDNLPGVFIGETYPQWESLDGITNRRAICLVQVPGGADLLPWGGGAVGLDAYAVEVHIVATDAEEAYRLAAPVRDIMLALPDTGTAGAVNVLEPVGFCDSDDVNPAFVHMQAEYTIIVHG